MFLIKTSGSLQHLHSAPELPYPTLHPRCEKDRQRGTRAAIATATEQADTVTLSSQPWVRGQLQLGEKICRNL